MTTSLLVTGGAGYIGSHTLLELIKAGHKPIVLDNFSNSCAEVLSRVEELSGCAIDLIEGDIRDEAAVVRVFEARRQANEPVAGVVHFAALKAVSESVEKPIDYYDNNVGGTLCLLRAMEKCDVRTLVFSSSATVYGEPLSLPYTEDHRFAPTNPYGHTKAMVEQILMDWCRASDDRSAVALRYFNPIGAHPSGRIGEAPQGRPNNLFPFITQVAVGKRDKLSVFGNDYETVDGTGVRDYLHVVDLAIGHVLAVAYLAGGNRGFKGINLGTGRGTSVLELAQTFERVTGRKVPYEILPRRSGDIAQAWADPTVAATLLGWRASRDIEEMCIDGWRWQSQNPDGYQSALKK
ncbi:UDP-glucose 4-epimerase GalE [Achromobacter xylosoxidans]|uniref:UDP-glucose 4-epimerase GalE n=1 Tax=Achromobacter aegrifaciens TaxID=1287736 RepID=UPI000D4B0EFD|nr:UDP-glucose 4-epimerase GalE [Achromobacter aegrifaciens]MDQ1759272.1 UDP-glucose 4-epimerase GalE [Achromobacter aegrifaciens]PTN50620.1 UDP-glucose 4-epimerase GalE [Achromobacter xylosoxidans]